jgi:spermidine synthase
VLVVGLGGGTLPQFLRMAYPYARIDVAEIDPAVVRVAEDYFNLRQDERLRVDVGDVRAFVESAAPGSYYIIILDAYGVGTVPRHLTTVEFLRAGRFCGIRLGMILRRHGLRLESFSRNN